MAVKKSERLSNSALSALRKDIQYSTTSTSPFGAFSIISMVLQVSVFVFMALFGKSIFGFSYDALVGFDVLCDSPHD
jgi:hypothetical protein